VEKQGRLQAEEVLRATETRWEAKGAAQRSLGLVARLGAAWRGVGHRWTNSTAGSDDDRVGRASLVMKVMENPMAPASVRLPGGREKLHVDMKFRLVEWRNSRAICRPRKTCRSRITRPKFAIRAPNRGKSPVRRPFRSSALGPPSDVMVSRAPSA
jgi:hypothetical protein